MNETFGSSPILRLGTRDSPLAMAQAVEARERLAMANGLSAEDIELVPVKASGDKILDRPLADIGGKALWTKELDQWLFDGRIDAAVHSMKDVETLRPDQLVIGAILPRADCRDVLVGADTIDAIAEGAVVGTSAPRRAAQLLHQRPDCKVVSIRGNVATRLAKLEAGEVDVTFLAAAGLERLGYRDLGTLLSVENWIPAAAQGAIGLECRMDDEKARSLLDAVSDSSSQAEVLADRKFLEALGGNCHSPVAAHSQFVDGRIHMRAAIFSPDGRQRIEESAIFPANDKKAPQQLAVNLLSRASGEITAHFAGPAE